MKTRTRPVRCALALGLFASTMHAGDPRVTSWFTTPSGQYARIYTNAAAQLGGHAVTTWGNGSQNQARPAYSGVQEIYSSSNWVYLRTTGLGFHTMGPWAAGFPNLPKNQHAFYRIPMNPAIPATNTTKTLTGLGAIGYFVDGVAMFDSRDAFYWTGSGETQGTGDWNREAYVNEGATFDPAKAHQENTGTYHYHANPIALRYLLGDHVDYNPASKIYSESTNAIMKHSPILGWVRDGFPVYGPYGYSVSNNAASPVTRLRPGYHLRNGQMGTDNLTNTLRTNGLPAWAVRLYGSSSAGPGALATYPVGRYMEDNAFLGDLTNALTGTNYQMGADYDLDECNGRFCVTPEFPNGTYAYFVCINADGTPAFPYNIGRAFYGNPTGASVTTLTETVTTNFVGGPNTAPALRQPTVNPNDGTVTLVWSSVDGGTYRVEASTALPGWTTNAAGIASQGRATALTTDASGSAHFYRIVRDAIADYDAVTNGASGGGTSDGILSVSPTSAARGTTITLTINLDPAAQPSPPPQNAPINSVTVGAISGTSNVHVSQTQVTSSITIPAGGATGSQTITVVFPGPPGNPTAAVTYTLVNGFTIN